MSGSRPHCPHSQRGVFPVSALVKPYERRVYATALALLHNEADAQDVAQEAILKAFTHLNQFRGESRFSTWLIQITVNEARMRRRKQHANCSSRLTARRTERRGRLHSARLCRLARDSLRSPGKKRIAEPAGQGAGQPGAKISRGISSAGRGAHEHRGNRAGLEYFGRQRQDPPAQGPADAARHSCAQPRGRLVQPRAVRERE